jgi:hypothetical protein
VTNRLNERGLDPAIRTRTLEALKILSDALYQSAASHPPAAANNLREAADGAMRAVARLMLEIDADWHIDPAPGLTRRMKSPADEGGA